MAQLTKSTQVTNVRLEIGSIVNFTNHNFKTGQPFNQHLS